jgi:hypothetical protein
MGKFSYWFRSTLFVTLVLFFLVDVYAPGIGCWVFGAAFILLWCLLESI